eukprot:TRINITY_DN25_c1_g2_i5.p1 TRINITY_DN25_c1_g2~~TRINITY_DN25_c1_g2_i5.p1  ORF type:complete len:976 (+),score=7.71 TRINITY_DN25_c1_g2_i5:1332-4259(+)
MTMHTTTHAGACPMPAPHKANKDTNHEHMPHNQPDKYTGLAQVTTQTQPTTKKAPPEAAPIHTFVRGLNLPDHLAQCTAFIADRNKQTTCTYLYCRRLYDASAVTTLTGEIQDIESNIDYLLRGADSVTRNVRTPFQPPLLPDPQPFVTHFEEKYASNGTPSLHTVSAMGQLLLAADDVVAGARMLKRRARQLDFSARFLDDLPTEAAAGLARCFNEWLADGVPPKYAVAWIFLCLKPGKRSRTSPKSYRPIAILCLLLKLFHATLYHVMRDAMLDFVRDGGFQYGSVSPQGIQEIVTLTEEWVQKSENNVALIADLESAYDMIPYDELLSLVQSQFGPRWRDAVSVVLHAQAVTIATHHGFTKVIRLQRGLIQGGLLSVPLFLLYTASRPRLSPVIYLRAIVDDVTSHTTRDGVQDTFDELVEWTAQRKLRLARTKIHLLSAGPASVEGELNGEPFRCEAKTTAVLLGSCLHAKKRVTSCPFHDTKVEAYARRTDLIAASTYCSTREKSNLHHVHALSTLSAHALSTCSSFDPPAGPSRDVPDVKGKQKARTATASLLPKHESEGSRGLQNFANSPLGFGFTTPEEYILCQRARAEVAAHPDATGRILPAKHKFERRFPPAPDPPTPPAPYTALVAALVDAADRDRPFVIATDGGMCPEAGTGTIGLCVGTWAAGAFIGACPSSTYAELCAILVMAVAFREAVALRPALRELAEWRCDSTSAIAYQGARRPSPMSDVLSDPLLPTIQWSKGHANDEYINRADAAATRAAASKQPALRVADYLSRVVTCPVMYHHPSQLYQLGRPFEFVKSALTYHRDRSLAKLVLKLVPMEALDRKKLRALQRLPGACDILQAFARGSLGHPKTTAACEVEGCPYTLTSLHILTTNDPTHTALLAPWGEVGTRLPPGCERTRDSILSQFARGDHAALAYVAARLVAFVRDRPVLAWARWLLWRLSTMHTYAGPRLSVPDPSILL